MDKSPGFLSFGLVMAVLLIGLGLAGSLLLTVEPAAANQPAAAQMTAAADPIILEGPTSLTPPYTTQCASYWYQYTNDRGQPAYLTLNVNDPKKRYNSAEWHTLLPEIGVYRIEAYIPPHDPLFWDCETDYTTLGDSPTAVYEVATLDSTITVTVNQAANAGKWVLLGEYLLAAESGVTVRISDLTREPNYQRTVSASALRITRVGPGFRQINPMGLINSFALRGVYMKNGQAQDKFGSPLLRFDMEEPLTLAINGFNDAPLARPAETTFRFNGPCDALDLNLQEIRQTAPGNWQEIHQMRVPPCTGTYTMTLAVSFENRQLTIEQPLKVDPGTIMGIMQQQGFDKCEVTSVEGMQVWWNESPYYTVNLYIGGLNRACSNTALTRDWVKAVQAQGWFFIPTWVGRQAPCMSRDIDKFSMDPATAYAEGKAEAAEAARAASRLGLFEARSQKSVIYLDIEGYRYSPYYSTECRTATKYFVSGWVDGMHTAGLQAGVYGGVCSSYMADWAALNPPPDAVWGAYWNLDPVYNPEETVWGWACVSDTMWPDQQRISQYAGDHPETWGGVTLGGIDSNAIDTILPAPRQFPIPMPASGQANAEADLPATEMRVVGKPLGDILPLGAGQGWVTAGGRAYKTTDGGRTWQALNLADLAGAARMTTAESAWMDLPMGEVALGWEAGSGGGTWRLALAGSSGPDRPAYADLQTLKGLDLAGEAGLPAGAGSLRAAPDGTLWLTTANGSCTGVKGTAGFSCAITYGLWESRDQGLTWAPLAVP